MIKIEDKRIFSKVLADAVKAIDANEGINSIEKIRLTNAVAKAAVRIEDRGEFMTWFADEGKLLIWSDSNNVYEVTAGGWCPCVAGQHAKMCWHRVARRLVEKYLAAVDQSALAKPHGKDLPYLKPTDTRPAETVGGVRI